MPNCGRRRASSRGQRELLDGRGERGGRDEGRTCGSKSCRHKRRNHSLRSPPASMPSSPSHLTRSGFLRLNRLSEICAHETSFNTRASAKRDETREAKASTHLAQAVGDEVVPPDSEHEQRALGLARPEARAVRLACPIDLRRRAASASQSRGRSRGEREAGTDHLALAVEREQGELGAEAEQERVLAQREMPA